MNKENIMNVPLFNALCTIFDDDVSVVNMGGEGALETVKDGKSLRAVRCQDGEEYKVNCPSCGDRKHRLFISHWAFKKVQRGDFKVKTNSLFYCHNERCSNYELKQQIGKEINFDDYKAEILPANYKKKKVAAFKFPDNCIPVNSPEAPGQVKEYLTGRKFDLDILYNSWDVHCCEVLEEYPYNGPKIIYPVYYNGEMAFWQARLCWEPTKDQQRQGVRKYYFPEGSLKSQVIYNRDMNRRELWTIIVEGITDVHRIGAKAISCLGKSPSTRQAQIIKHSLGGNAGVLLLDADAAEEALEFYEKYREGLFDKGFYLVQLSKGDPADYTVDELWELIIEKVKGG